MTIKAKKRFFVAFLGFSALVDAFAFTTLQVGSSRAFSSTLLNTQSRKHAPKSPLQNYETFGDGALSEDTFAELYSDYLPDWLTQRCVECGWKYPTLVQQRALDSILMDEMDVVIQAQTGSGKTLAYLLPLLALVDPTRAAIQAVVVVPTRELGLQVARVAKRLAAGMDDKLLIMNLLQGSQHKRQRAWAWAEPPQVVIGTPQELTNMVQFGGIRYNAVRYVVVDEVDACLLRNAGSMNTNLQGSPIHTLLSRYLSPTFEVAQRNGDDLAVFANDGTHALRRPLQQQRQTVFCSATIPQHRHFLQQCVQNQWTVREPVHVCASPGELLPPTLQHTFMVCSQQDKKLSALRKIIQKISNNKNSKALIFCEPNRPIHEMAQVLAHDLDGLYWKEGYGETQERDAKAIISVLRYEESLSQRAAAMQGFQGMTNVPEGRIVQDETNIVSKAQGNGKFRVLLSTDLAARGLDVSDVTHVIQLDLPHDADTYVHRAGRTGRLGRKGTVVSIIISSQEFVLDRLANKLGLEMKCIARQTKKQRKGPMEE